MPIKFRCQHCRQLLGISRSRAGAVVDCPQCGRSLRVPELDGRLRKLPEPGKTQKHDTSLLSALSELSSLQDDAEAAAATSPGSPSGSAQTRNPDPNASHANVILDLEPLSVSEPVDVEISAQNPDFDESDSQLEQPVPLAESLEELAALNNDAVSADLLDDMRRVRSERGFLSSFLFGAIAAFALGFATGWFVRPKTESPSRPEVVQQKDPNNPQAETTAPDSVPTAGQRNIEGVVEFRNAAGHSLPDQGAIVFLLPTERKGTFKLSARSLLKPEGNEDRQAVIAALQALGGDMVIADANGRYRLSGRAKTNSMVVAVSRNTERPTDVPVAAQILAVLEMYFETTEHISGRLAVQSQLVQYDESTTSSVNFEFQPIP